MDLLKNCAQVYSKYIGYDYTFVLDCEMSLTASFRVEYFYHLIGLQHLTDIKQVTKSESNPSPAIYKRIMNGKISQSLVEKSEFYSDIYKRLLYFCNLDEILSAKLIVDFDNSKVNTKLLSRYLLYKQYEDGYAIMGLKYDRYKDLYVPETFIFEETDYYIKDQISYNVIDIIPVHYKNSKKNKSLC